MSIDTSNGPIIADVPTDGKIRHLGFFQQQPPPPIPMPLSVEDACRLIDHAKAQGLKFFEGMGLRFGFLDRDKVTSVVIPKRDPRADMLADE